MNRVSRLDKASLGSAYWRLWWAGVIDRVGDGAFAVALPLVATSLTHDPRLIAAVSAATYAPWLLVSLFAGVAVDRYERRRLMWLSQAFQATVVALLVPFALWDSLNIALLCAAGFLLGTAETVFANASQAILPQLVPAEKLTVANGRQFVGQSVSQSFLGPPLGSSLVAIGAALVFVADCLTFVFSACLLYRLPRTVASDARHAKSQVFKDIADGLRWLFSHKVLRSLVLLLAVNNFAGQLAMATLVLYATRLFHVSTAGYGVMLACIAVGAILGGFASQHVVRRLGSLPTLISAVTLNGLVVVGAAAAPNAGVATTLLATSGFLTTLWNVVTVTLRQRIVPRELLGRVNSVYRMVGWGLLPLGALAGGFVAADAGLRAPFIVAGLLRLAIFAVVCPTLIRAVRLSRRTVDAP